MDRAGLTGDPRFYARSGPHTLTAVAAAAAGSAPLHPRQFSGVAPLGAAGPDEVSFFDNKRYLPALAATRAGAVIIGPNLADKVPAGTVPIITPEPYVGWAKVAALFYPAAPVSPGVHASAVIDPSATVDPTAEIGPLTVVGARAEIAARCRIAPLAVIGDGVVIGPDCRIGAGVSISHALLGARVTLFPGARIGQDGFGFAITKAGPITVPQLGRVVLEDDVEIGANSTVDRGAALDTVIGAGSRLDNLVQIGHNVRLGRCCVIVAQAGIAGSTELEDFVVVAAQAGLAGHLRIGRQARIGAQAGVMADVAAGLDVVGSPSQPVKTFFRQIAWLRRMARERSVGTPSLRDAGQGDAGPAGAGQAETKQAGAKQTDTD